MHSFGRASRNSTKAAIASSLKLAVMAKVIRPGIAHSTPSATKASGSLMDSVGIPTKQIRLNLTGWATPRIKDSLRLASTVVARYAEFGNRLFF